MVCANSSRSYPPGTCCRTTEFGGSGGAGGRGVSAECAPGGEQGQYRRALDDADHRVRIEAVRALVSVDDADGVAAAASDDNREVRIAAANGLSTLRTGADAVRRLVGDRDPLVRAAALAALGAVGSATTIWPTCSGR